MSKISVISENLTEQNRNTQNILRADSIEFQKDLCGKTSVICGGEPEQCHFLENYLTLHYVQKLSFDANNA